LFGNLEDLLRRKSGKSDLPLRLGLESVVLKRNGVKFGRITAPSPWHVDSFTPNAQSAAILVQLSQTVKFPTLFYKSPTDNPVQAAKLLLRQEDLYAARICDDLGDLGRGGILCIPVWTLHCSPAQTDDCEDALFLFFTANLLSQEFDELPLTDKLKEMAQGYWSKDEQSQVG
jgi:hypothetical protein